MTESVGIINRCDKELLELDISGRNIVGIVDLQKFTKLKKFICSHNQITKIINTPETLVYLDCSYNKIKEISLSINVRHLDCSNNLITNLEVNCVFEGYFNISDNPMKKLYYSPKSSPEKYPELLKEITFGNFFDQPIDNLPKNLKTLHFQDNSDFNKPLDNLPSGLKKIHFESNSVFDQPLDNLPNGITHLILGNGFNQPLDNLPESLVHLEFGYDSYFRYRLDNIPNSLKLIIIDKEYFYENQEHVYELCSKVKVKNNSIHNN